MEEPVSSRFKMFQLNPYDGTTDLLYYLESYKTLLQIQGAADTLLYISFLATLCKAAGVWYLRLDPRSMHFLKQLER